MDELLKYKSFATHALAASGSVALSTSLTYPLDSLKVLVQVGSGSSKHLSTTYGLKRVQALSGSSGLYNGLCWLTSGRVLGLGARFGVYEILTAFFKDGRENSYVYFSEALMAGIAAGTVESFISSPFEIIKLRSQVASASCISNSTAVTEKGGNSPAIARFLRGYSPNMKAFSHSAGLLSTLSTNHTDMINALKQYPWMLTGTGKAPTVCSVRRPLDIISLEGWGAFWRSLRAGIVRDSVFGGVFFVSWQFLHQVLLNWKAVEMEPPPRTDADIGPLSPLAVSVAAGLSGSLAAAASHCFDTAKTRSQCIVLPKYVSMERKLLKWNLPGKRFERLTGIHPADRNILFRGIWLRMARSGLGSFALVGGYFWAIDKLS